MEASHRSMVRLGWTAILIIQAAVVVRPLHAAEGGPGVFGIASGGESFGDHARLFPLLREAGVGMVRSFPEWANFQPEKGRWDWSHGDALVASARKSQIQIAGVFMYLAPTHLPPQGRELREQLGVELPDRRRVLTRRHLGEGGRRPTNRAQK